MKQVAVLSISTMLLVSSVVLVANSEVRAQAEPNQAKQVAPQPEEAQTQTKLVEAYDVARKKITEAADAAVKAVKALNDENLDQKIETLLKNIEQDPRDFESHVGLCDALVARIDQLIATNQTAMSLDVITKRDHIVAILTELSQNMSDRTEVTKRKAAEAAGAAKGGYESVAQSEARFGRGYKSLADEYAKIKLEANVAELTSNIEYLRHVRDSLLIIRPALAPLLADIETLRDLQQMSVRLDEIQNAVERFSKAVQLGVLLEKGKVDEQIDEKSQS